MNFKHCKHKLNSSWWRRQHAHPRFSMPVLQNGSLHGGLKHIGLREKAGLLHAVGPHGPQSNHDKPSLPEQQMVPTPQDSNPTRIAQRLRADGDDCGVNDTSAVASENGSDVQSDLQGVQMRLEHQLQESSSRTRGQSHSQPKEGRERDLVIPILVAISFMGYMGVAIIAYLDASW
ncbi:hypothetical protein CEUSTIGMA_g7702.t1 [Chlamydomonas eustigma]|uniref:Uncharacterized protein n=1 Tax=Chlamydomonas eustigma TaxID=1157962 RepID=A0A250XB27_9CHLO|nr:hypothetical protein CEUSTIGMA_g7702.t1 [Chlamydomonas eustigma]|eukprot:GAX80264.1 hypothetical protein CEUSTIGMA_g7702.t1 [Chlamydomonas eustigma]